MGAFACLLWDVVQPDHVMIAALTVLMAAGIVSVEEGLAGFSNEGLLTVATLFVVAAGISATGGLDWYMSKLLGKPRTIAGAQLRLMVPIALTSGFLNNTPVVAVMIPIVQRWAENIHIPKEQVMIPLSFASILGGTCTLIGTSTNLVVLGMLQQWKGADGTSTTRHTMGLFDLGLYGIPCALTGMTYMLLASRALLPKGKAASRRNRGGSDGNADNANGGAEDLIVGARLQPWSAAVGKTVGNSGLRGLPGLYLVSVKRDETLMRAVGPEFVLTQGDVLYFTGMVENLGTVCAEHGLEAMTAEHDESSDDDDDSDEGSGDEGDVRLGDDARLGKTDSFGSVTGSKDGTPKAGEESDASKDPSKNTCKPSSKKPSKPTDRDVNVPTAVPEMSELMEIQMMARSQAIGGVKGSWDQNATKQKLKTKKSTYDSDTSATSGGESEGFEGPSPRGAFSDSEQDKPRGRKSEDEPSTSVRRTTSNASPTKTQNLRRRRRRVSNAAAEFASAVAVDPGERRALKLYDRQRRDSGSRKHSSAKEKRDKEVARDAAARALGPPRVTVEPDPDVATPESQLKDDGDTPKTQTFARTVLGVSAMDRPGLLHDISQGLNRLRVQLLHCEASVVANRSVSIWRLQAMDESTTREEIRTVIKSLLNPTSGSAATKEKGQNVLRVRVRKGSLLVGRAPAEVNFRSTYGAAIVAMQRGGRAPGGKLGQVQLQEGDTLVLQLNEDSPLLAEVPSDLNLMSDNGTNDADGVITSPQKSSSLMKSVKSVGSMVGMSAKKEDTRGYSIRSRVPSAGVIDQSSIAVDIDDTTVASTGDGTNEKETSDSDGSVSVAIPDVRGYSIRSPIQTTTSTTETKKNQAIRQAHRDLEIVGTGTTEAGKEFLIAVRVEPRSQFIKKTADEAGLRQLPGLFLVSIERHRSASTAVQLVPATAPHVPVTVSIPDQPASLNKQFENQSTDQVDIVDPGDDALQEDDVLWYAGNANSIASVRKIPGLAPYSNDQVDKLSNVNSQERRLIQAVVAKTGPLVGKSIREIKFRTRYNAVVLAVHREGQRVHARIGDVILHPGDVLLLDAGPDFHREAVNNSGSGFALVSVLEDSAPPRLRLLVPVLIIAVAMIAVYTAGVTELLVAAIFAASIMIACGALSEQEARDAIKWDVIVTIAAAFGMSKALQNSGVAGIIAKTLVDLAEKSGTGDVGLLTAVYFATFLISNVVTNNAAAALMFPIAAEAAEKAGFDLMSISFIVMLAASASFMSPFGYQTNLMVYGPGGYVFADFLRFGVPMQVVQLVVSVAVIALGANLWYVSWCVTAILFGVTCAVMMWERNPAEYIFRAWRKIHLMVMRRRGAHADSVTGRV